MRGRGDASLDSIFGTSGGGCDFGNGSGLAADSTGQVMWSVSVVVVEDEIVSRRFKPSVLAERHWKISSMKEESISRA